MTEEELKRLERLEAEATRAPWRADEYMVRAVVRDEDGEECIGSFLEGNDYEDTTLIAEARNALPALIAALRAERRRAEVAEARLALSEATIEFASAVTNCEWEGTNASQERKERARAAVSETTARLVALGVEP